MINMRQSLGDRPEGQKRSIKRHPHQLREKRRINSSA
jgi:hypothetical protein